MDTSEQRIRMSDCPEIQDGWEPVSRDLVNSKDSNLIYTCAYKHLDLYKFYTPDSSASYTSVSLRNLRIKGSIIAIVIPWMLKSIFYNS